MSTPPANTLPEPDDAGLHGTWEVTDRNGTAAVIDADFLGFGSSYRPSHNHVYPPFAKKGYHCSTCRWYETRIFQEGTRDEDGRYVIITQGPSVVPGEVTFITFGYAADVPELLEVLTLQPDGSHKVIPPVARALEMAAEYSDRINDVYSKVRTP